MGLVLFQVLILNNVNVGGLVNPYVYPLFILLLPIEIAGWGLLLLAFGLGITIDVFAGTLGMHAFATVLMTVLRPAVISRISQRGSDMGKLPSLGNQGFTWMLLYSTFLVAVHHLSYFIVEYWSVNAFGVVMLKFLVNTIVSMLIMFLLLYAFKSSKKK